MSTRALKWLTSLCIAIGVSLIVSWPMWVGRTPTRKEPRLVRRAFAVRVLTGVSTLTVVVIGAGAGAFFLMRRATLEYKEASIQNMKELVEGARQDQHAKESESEA